MNARFRFYQTLTQKISVKKVAEWRGVARFLIEVKHNQSKQRHDSFRSQAPFYSVGDLVLVTRRIRKMGKTSKFMPKFIGLFQIVKRVAETCFQVEDLPGRRRKRKWRRFNTHVSQLRKFHARSEIDWAPEENEMEEWMEPDASSECEREESPIDQEKREHKGIVSRVGRVIKSPGHLKDFVCNL